MPQTPNPGVIPGQNPTGGITVTHNGTGNGTVAVSIVNPANLTGHDYKVGTQIQTYYNDAAGKWHALTPKIKRSPNGTSDVSPSSMAFIGQYGIKGGTLDVIGALNLVSPDYDYVDGIKLTLPSNVTINSAETISNCANGNTEKPVIDNTAHTITWGVNDTSGFGCFSGSQDVKFNVTAALPMTVNYLVYDDGYGFVYVDTTNPGAVKNAVGVDTITTATATTLDEYQWFVTDVTTGNTVLNNQTIFGGVDIYAAFNGAGSTNGLGSAVGVGANTIVEWFAV